MSGSLKSRNDGRVQEISEITRGLKAVAKELNIPIIASGGAGSVQHFIDTFSTGKSDAALAASVFHFGEIKITDLKKELRNNNIEVRL